MCDPAPPHVPRVCRDSPAVQVSAVKCSPTDSDAFVTCGVRHCKFWRCEDHGLSARSVHPCSDRAVSHCCCVSVFSWQQKGTVCWQSGARHLPVRIDRGRRHRVLGLAGGLCLRVDGCRARLLVPGPCRGRLEHHRGRPAADHGRRRRRHHYVEPVRRLLRVRRMCMCMVADATAVDGRADRSIMWAYAWARGHSSERLPTPPSSARSPVCCRAPGWSRGV
jgi:hypothetical protein